jgi:hypothetical protein
MYWQEQLHRTRCPGEKAQSTLVLQTVAGGFERHPCTRQRTPEVLAGWKAWAAEHARAFQRASSAVEGRNGSLSQMQHNHRGLPTRRYQVWAVLHNFDCRAADGTTPASRFFRRSRQVIEGAWCPGLSGYPTLQPQYAASMSPRSGGV